MAEKKVRTIAPEVSKIARLLLDTEKKLEKLQEQIDQIDKQKGPAPSLTPSGFPIKGSTNQQRQILVSEQEKLVTMTLELVDDMRKSTSGQPRQDIDTLKYEWLIDIQPMEEGREKKLENRFKEMGRIRSELWRSAALPEVPSTMLEQNKGDITEKTPTLLDKARGLQKEFSYLDTNEPVKDAPGKDAIGKDDGPDIEPEID